MTRSQIVRRFGICLCIVIVAWTLPARIGHGQTQPDAVPASPSVLPTFLPGAGQLTQSGQPQPLRTRAVVQASHSDSPAAATAIVGEEVLTAEKLTSELTAIEALTDIDAEAKKEHVDRINKAIKWLQDEQESARRKTELEAQLAAVPELLRQAQEELAKPSPPVTVEFPSGATVAQLETKLAELRHQVELDEAALRAKEGECENRLQRLSEISKEIIEIDKKVADAKLQLNTLTGAELLTKTKRFEQRARLRGRQQQLVTIKLEQQRLEAITELLPMQRDLAKRTATNSKKLLQSWQTAVDTWRKEESKRQAAEARRVAQNSHPALKSLATKNAEIAELRIQTAAEIERLAKTIKRIGESSKQYEEAFEELKKKVEHAGATSSTGVLLLKQRDELPRDLEFQERSAFVQKVMPEAHLKLMELNQLRRQMSDPAEMATQMLSSFSKSLANYDQQQVLDVVTGLLSDRRDFLDKASVDQNTYLQDLNDLELANQALQEQVSEFRQYLDQRVMWIRSAEPMTLVDAKQAGQGILTLASPSRWLEVLRVGGGEFLRRPAGGIAVISLFLLLLLGRARLLAMQSRLMAPVTEREWDDYWPNLAAMLIAVILSARWPLLLMAVGYRLIYAAGATAWTQAVGQSCLTTMVFLWGWELLREICRRGGIGEQLFLWPARATSAIRNILELTLLVGIPLLSLLQLSQFGELAGLKGLERSLFVVSMLLCSLQYGILQRPQGRLMNSLGADERYSRSIFYTARTPIWLVSTCAPLALALLSIAGYHFSAYQLSARLTETGAAVVAVILLHSMFLSWLDVKAHNFHVRELLRRESDAENESEVETKVGSHLAGATYTMGADDGEESEFEEDPSELAVNQPKSHQEFRDLLRYASVITLLCCGWFIWASVLPALRVLDHVEFWHNIETVAETYVNNNGDESIRTIEHSVPTTLTDVLMAIVVCIGTFTVSRRLPGLLELMVLDRIPFEQGGRQAIAILVRYAAILTGLLVACHIIHISWSSVQWLAAAMTVGLGFGLQEIFANLVSGLIILFERPIRAGDLVTVGNVTGTVTRMQMRATTITDFDRRELIVPNKTFITDNVINWTLSDPISRVVLPVGVAYGTDVQKTQAILLRIARRSAFVLNEPGPSTLFKGFGDSTLNLELRVFIPKRDLYLDVVNELNNAIVREFARYKINIAFPQRDLHIRSVESLRPLLASLHEPVSEANEKRAAG